MSEPRNAPYVLKESPGKRAICTCTESANLPYCDGSHKGSDVWPVAYTAGASCKVVFCGCKTSDRAPICDGSACAG